MKQIVVLSGKGGTGKTSITAAFAHLASISNEKESQILVDADVDAANLSLIVQPNLVSQNEFWGGSIAEIDSELCGGCENCLSVCRYDAILPDTDHIPVMKIDPMACDGCAACVYACPNQAIQMTPQQEGFWYKSQTPYGELFHAELFAGRENSGKLVTLIKQNARLFAEDTNSDLVIIDGPPGIGCPVISACAGCDLAIIITEPSVSGVHDMKRILATVEHFHVKPVVCINKSDIYNQAVDEIQRFTHEKSIPVIGEIPYDDRFYESMQLGMPITKAFPKLSAVKKLEDIWVRIKSELS